MRGFSRGLSRAPVVLLASLCSLVGCGGGALDDALKQARDLASDGKQVAFAVIDSDGHVYPKTLIVRKEVHKIIWLADGDSLKVDFQAPSPVTVTCVGSLCFAPAPPATDGKFVYSGSVTKKGVQKPLDPQLEVVP